MWMETHYLPFSELGHSVRTGRPGAEKYLGAPLLTWMNEDADRAKLFSQAMGDVTRGLRTGMFDGYRLPEGKVVADIGVRTAVCWWSCSSSTAIPSAAEWSSTSQRPPRQPGRF
ncbi:hypothetical protein NKH77_24295 [Streptomyces sp. M19]